MRKILEAIGPIKRIHREPVELGEAFPDFASRFASRPGCVVLLSGSESDCSEHNLLAIEPWLALRGRNGALSLHLSEAAYTLDCNPWDGLQEVLRFFALPGPPAALPVECGLFGYLAYDLKNSLERLPCTALDDLGLPHLLLYAPRFIVIQERSSGYTSLLMPVLASDAPESLAANLERFRELRRQAASSGRPSEISGRLRSNFSRSAYTASIEQIKEYIRAGHIYQVNMSQRFELGFRGRGFDLFRSLFRLNPAPFYAFVQAGDHEIISTSPERFLKRRASRVETRPIKGTRPRGRTEEADQRLAQELRQSPKDDAELSMIVDLLRNDLGKVCRAGSIRVSEHKRIEPYENVFHLVSIVEGRLARDKDSVDLLRAAFPGGSITGCPKVRAMEIIDELEPQQRHVYTGSIGYLGFQDTLDLSIAIRTATLVNDRLLYSVGGGVVFDSDPEEEFEETLHKGRSLEEIFTAKSHARAAEEQVWHNGALKPAAEAAHTALAPGVQFGWGLFETIRAVRGEILFLERHLERFAASWKAIFPSAPPELCWASIIRRVLEANGLLETTAAVKVLASKGSRSQPPFDDLLLVQARRYVHRLEALQRSSLRLVSHPEPRQTPLAAHKSANYLYYELARRFAASQGGDEALILNPDGTISETNSANLLLIQAESCIVPASRHVLPGVAQAAALEMLHREGFSICRRPVWPSELPQMEQTLLTNSLMGAVPVESLDGDPLPSPRATLCSRLNATLLGS
jgi:para-aminobenzoate synthetase component 1